MVVWDRMNCARFRKSVLITFFELFSENGRNSCSYHNNRFGCYVNRHLRTYDLKLILQTRHRTSHIRCCARTYRNPTSRPWKKERGSGGLVRRTDWWRSSKYLCFINFPSQKRPKTFSFLRGVFDWGNGQWRRELYL